MASFELVLPEFLISTGDEFDQTERFVHEGKGNTDSAKRAALRWQRDRIPMNEATVRIKINKLIEAAGWRFVADGAAPANICLDPNVTSRASDHDAWGNAFEKTSRSYIDFRLSGASGFPYTVLEWLRTGRSS